MYLTSFVLTFSLIKIPVYLHLYTHLYMLIHISRKKETEVVSMHFYIFFPKLKKKIGKRKIGLKGDGF